jgi:hypothetical protein
MRIFASFTVRFRFGGACCRGSTGSGLGLGCFGAGLGFGGFGAGGASSTGAGWLLGLPRQFQSSTPYCTALSGTAGAWYGRGRSDALRGRGLGHLVLIVLPSNAGLAHCVLLSWSYF